MALTPEQLQILRKPFPHQDHEFIQGFVYLTEEAITTRLEEVDSAWMFELLHVANNGAFAIVTARMTVNDVFRDGIGMQKVNEKAGEAEKGAATDALKRCARLFGIGRYLLGAPKESEFAGWLANLTPVVNREPMTHQNGVSRGGDKLVMGTYNIRHMKVQAQRGRDGKQFYQCVMQRAAGDPIVFTGSEPFVKSGLFTNDQMNEWKLNGDVEFNPELRVQWDGKTAVILGVVGEAVAS